MLSLAVASTNAFVPPPTLLTARPAASIAATRLMPDDVNMLFDRLRNKLRKNKENEADTSNTAAAVATLEAPAAVEEESLIARADALHAAKDVQGLFDLLSGEDPTSDDELAWRIARAHHDLAEEIVGDDSRKEQLVRDGLAIAEAAKDASGSGFALKWYAILLGRLGDFLPTKEKVANSFKIKEALEASAALLPEDPSVQTALGQWCYKVAGSTFQLIEPPPPPQDFLCAVFAAATDSTTHVCARAPSLRSLAWSSQLGRAQRCEAPLWRATRVELR